MSAMTSTVRTRGDIPVLRCRLSEAGDGLAESLMVGSTHSTNRVCANLNFDGAKHNPGYGHDETAKGNGGSWPNGGEATLFSCRRGAAGDLSICVARIGASLVWGQCLGRVV